ncbi:MAG: thiamine pyrophosphate-binding protein [Candidatus Lokiarchaeota archaeon]|nr:thiamine pyrophosphate-binding protein [Candidatus Lokiarchaeota archaeon]
MEKKGKINGGDVLVKCLLEEDVKYMFGITGGQLLTIFDAIYRWGREKGIETVMFRHEQAAAHAADAWARVTNKPGICFGTVGPGALDLVPGVGAAWSDNIPVIAIIPQVISDTADKFSLQGGLDQIQLFKPITKYQKSVRKITEIPDAVRKCFREATGGRPRPVLLEIYEDAFLEQIEENEISIYEKNRYRAIEKPSISDELIQESLKMLINAEKPLIISGGGVARAEAWKELQEFAEYLQIPVATTISGIGTISNKSNCHLGATVGAIQSAANKSDVVLSLGCKFSYVMGYGEEPTWKNSQQLIQVDIDPAMIGRTKPVSLGIVGDCKSFLNKMLKEVKKIEKVESRRWLEKLKKQSQQLFSFLQASISKETSSITAERMVKEVLEFIDEDAILILDGGNITVSAFEQINLYKQRNPLSTLQSTGMGHLGTSVPYGIGAKLAKPNKQIVSISGDGSFMINIQDLETAVRLNLKNLIYVVANNSAWGMIKTIQQYAFNQSYIDVDFPDFNFAQCAKSFGCYGEIVTDPNNIKDALERAKNSGKVAVIDVKIKYETPLSTKITYGINF